jgi:hypothetical protein
MTTEIKRVVTDLRIPICSYGSRSGWATAIVDGVHKRLHMSRSDRSDYSEHKHEIREAFAAGEGETIDA